MNPKLFIGSAGEDKYRPKLQNCWSLNKSDIGHIKYVKWASSIVKNNTVQSNMLNSTTTIIMVGWIDILCILIFRKPFMRQSKNWQ